jgi:hypothetical protein
VFEDLAEQQAVSAGCVHQCSDAGEVMRFEDCGNCHGADIGHGIVEFHVSLGEIGKEFETRLSVDVFDERVYR